MGKEFSDMEKQISDTFVKRIDEYMSKNHMRTDREIYERAEIEQARFSQLRNHKALPTVCELSKIAKALNVSTDYLIDPNCESGGREKNVKEITYYDLLKLIVELDINKQIRWVTSENNIYDTREFYCIALSDEQNFEIDSFMQWKLKEWHDLSRVYLSSEYYVSCYSKPLETLKNVFLASVTNTVAIYKEHTPNDEDLPFGKPER